MPAATRVEPLAGSSAVTVAWIVSAICRTRPAEPVLPDVSVATIIDRAMVCGACSDSGESVTLECLMRRRAPRD